MPTIIVPSGNGAHANPDQAARQRADRLAKATPEQIETALAYLSAIDPEAFEIAFTAVTPAVDKSADLDDQPEDEEAVPACRACGALVGIFPEHGLDWQHYRGDGITSGAQELYDPGHTPEVIWCLPEEL